MALKERASELEWLRFFYDEAQEVFGPANSDVTEIIIEGFEKESGKRVPKGYKFRDTDE